MTEMNKLRDALNNAGIDWYDDSLTSPFGFANIVRTKFTNNKGVKVSVICGDGTYGGEIGLLETMPPVHSYDEDDPFADDVEGYLTAQDIIDTWL